MDNLAVTAAKNSPQSSMVVFTRDLSLRIPALLIRMSVSMFCNNGKKKNS